jgi:hypothetical protein
LNLLDVERLPHLLGCRSKLTGACFRLAGPNQELGILVRKSDDPTDVKYRQAEHENGCQKQHEIDNALVVERPRGKIRAKHRSGRSIPHK